MRGWRFTCLASVASGVLVCLTGCGPRIRAFDVMPRSLCPAQQARVTWDVSGTPTLLVRLSDPRLGVNEVDEELVHAPDTLEFTLVATKGAKETVQHLDVLQYADSAATEVVFPTTLVGDTLVARGVKNPLRWQEAFVLTSVSSGSGRALTVRHAGREAPLDASGAPSDAFAGVPVQGEWEIRSLLSTDERTTPAARPDRLRVRVVMGCARTEP